VIHISQMEDKQYASYRSRWGVLVAVWLITAANNASWISFAAITTQSADYYGRKLEEIDLLTTVSFLVGIPSCLCSTYLVNKKGLRITVMVATISTFIGGLLRLITAVGLDIDKDTQFWLVLVAQAFNGVGNPIAVALPTKVSQNWFPENEVVAATALLAMSLPVGIAAGYGGTSALVQDDEDVSRANWVWFIPTALATAAVLVFVRASNPPSPPSKSAEQTTQRIPYLKTMKNLLTNKKYILIMLTLGGAVGFFNAVLTLLQKMMCSR